MKLSMQRGPRRRGAHAVEGALCLLLLLPLLLTIFEFCRYTMLRQLTENAAREGARFAVVNTYDSSSDDVKQRVRTMLGKQEGMIGDLQINVYRSDPTTGANTGSWTDAKFGEGVAVEITGAFHPVGGWLQASIPIRIRSIMYSEAN